MRKNTAARELHVGLLLLLIEHAHVHLMELLHHHTCTFVLVCALPVPHGMNKTKQGEGDVYSIDAACVCGIYTRVAFTRGNTVYMFGSTSL